MDKSRSLSCHIVRVDEAEGLRKQLRQCDNGGDDTDRHGPKVLVEGFEPVGDTQFKCLEICLCCDVSAYRVADCRNHRFSLSVVEARVSKRLGSLERIESH